jgi:aminoglycoside N3'-acetyltransferase
MRRLLRRLPQPLRDRLRAARRRYRSARHRARERVRPVLVERDAVAAALRDAGVGRGDAVFFQAGMAAFGTIEGGPETVIAALRETVGEEGLIAMPAFPLTGPAVEHLSRHPVFDARRDASMMGAISERFRAAPGVVRSVHPTHSVCAWGRGAEALVAGHELAATPFGEGTPFAKLLERGAIQVFFGSGVRAITMYHAFEVLRAPPYPIEVFLPEPVAIRSIRPDGEEVEVRTPVHDPRLGPGRIDVDPALEADVRRRLLEGGMTSVRLGRGEVLAQPLEGMFATFERMLGEGVTIYDPRHLREAQPR